MPIKGFLRELSQKVRDDDVTGLAAQMAFYFTFALFPGLIFLVAALGYLPIEGLVAGLEQYLRATLPPTSASMLIDYIRELTTTRSPTLLSISALASFWAASRGIAALMHALNVVLALRETRPFVRRQMVALEMTVVAILLLGGAHLLLVGGIELGWVIGRMTGLDEIFVDLWETARWPVALLLSTLFVAMAYHFLPTRSVPFRYLLIGALPAVIGWIGAGLGFRLWVMNFGRYDFMYGSLASVIVLMFSLYIGSLIFLLGGQIAYQVARSQGWERPEQSS